MAYVPAIAGLRQEQNAPVKKGLTRATHAYADKDTTDTHAISTTADTC